MPSSYPKGVHLELQGIAKTHTDSAFGPSFRAQHVSSLKAQLAPRLPN